MTPSHQAIEAEKTIAKDKTFDTHDRLSRKDFATKLQNFLKIEHEFVEGSLVVSLNGQFGSGKTTFLSHWKTELDRQNNINSPKAIIINAWADDYCGDPLLSIVNSLIEHASVVMPSNSPEAANHLREAAKDVAWFAVGLANHAAAHWAGVDPIKAGEFAEDKREGRKPKIPDFIALYQERTSALKKLKEALRAIYGGNTPKTFLLVDELDRCRPDYAISYLETIKHIFDIHGLVFVLTVDSNQLESSAKALFGSGLNFSDYFRKFVHRSINLPEPTEEELVPLCQAFVNDYLSKEGLRSSLMSFDHGNTHVISSLFSSLRMPPRQIQETFRIIGHACAGAAQGNLYRHLAHGVILMAVLKVQNPPLYKRIGTEKISPLEMGKHLEANFDRDGLEFWFWIFVTGCEGVHSSNIIDAIRKAASELGLISGEPNANIDEQLSDYRHNWGGAAKSRWKQIYTIIEQVRSFSA